MCLFHSKVHLISFKGVGLGQVTSSLTPVSPSLFQTERLTINYRLDSSTLTNQSIYAVSRSLQVWSDGAPWLAPCSALSTPPINARPRAALGFLSTSRLTYRITHLAHEKYFDSLCGSHASTPSLWGLINIHRAISI